MILKKPVLGSSTQVPSAPTVAAKPPATVQPVRTATTPATPKAIPPGALTLEGFTPVNRMEASNYVTLVYGEEYSGKSRFALSGPLPIAYLCMDMKTQDLVQHMIESGGIADPSQILITGNLSRQGEISSTKMYVTKSEDIEKDPELMASMIAYRKHVEKIKTLIVAAAKHPLIRTLVVDSATIFFEDVQFANYGRTTAINPRDRMKADREFMDILQLFTAARTSDGRPKHLILTARSSNLWAKDANGKEAPTSGTRPTGCTKMGYFIANTVELVAPTRLTAEQRSLTIAALRTNTRKTARPMLPIADPRRPEPTIDYYANLKGCIRRPELAGIPGTAFLRNEEISYTNLMQVIYPNLVL